MTDLKRFEKFLATINLAAYREKYSPIKVVELDLPKDIQPLKIMYETYWDNRNCEYPDFENFYRRLYWPSVKTAAEDFRKKSFFSKETFAVGLPARIYRTWASLLTQIQGAYLMEVIHGKGNVRMSVSQDYRGRDIILRIGKNENFGIQIKKITRRKVSRAVTPAGKNINVEYEVPGGKYTKTGKIRKPFADWEKEWKGKLKHLDNGFIIFDREMFAMGNMFPAHFKMDK